MPIVKIRKQPIELYKVLKLANIAASGGEAKMLVAEGQVMVNGVMETRKRKKLVDGDVIETDGVQIQVQLLHT
jgi:ribosome-associated protein